MDRYARAPHPRALPRAASVVLLAALLLAATEQETLPDAELLCHLGECRGIHQTLAQVRELALVQVRMRAIDEVGNDPAEDRITQELEALIGLDTVVFGDVRAVPHRGLDEALVGELIADPRAQGAQGLVHVRATASAMRPTMSHSTISLATLMPFSIARALDDPWEMMHTPSVPSRIAPP